MWCVVYLCISFLLCVFCRWLSVSNQKTSLWATCCFSLCVCVRAYHKVFLSHWPQWKQLDINMLPLSLFLAHSPSLTRSLPPSPSSCTWFPLDRSYYCLSVTNMTHKRPQTIEMVLTPNQASPDTEALPMSLGVCTEREGGGRKEEEEQAIMAYLSFSCGFPSF